MKTSAYTIFIEDNEDFIIFNTLTEAFFKVPLSKSEIYKTIICDPDSHISNFPSFITKVKDRGFIIDDEEDEFTLVKNKYHFLRRPDMAFIMILPTYQCNLRCWYCIQNHSDSWMTKETIEKTKKLIDKRIQTPSIKAVHISWFGGEPLLNYSALLEITQYAQQECVNAHKVFTSSITTNSTLLSSKRIEELRDAGIVDYQITIDGTREIHNSVKVLGSLSSFDVTLNNINKIARHTHVNLRFNYTAQNLNPERIIKQLKESLDPKNLNNISFNLFKVWQEGEESIDQRKVDQLFELGNSIGLKTHLFHSSFCYVDQYNFDCIFPNGKIGKCDNLSPDDVYGTLETDGSITWDKANSKFAEPILFTNQVKCECEKCEYLPFCWGPCSVRREQMWRQKGDIHCMFEDKRTQLKHYIINFIRNNEPQN